MTQPTDHRRDIEAASVARSAGLTRAMAKALAIGLPAFMSELRTAIAAMTVQRIGLKPRTMRKGMLTLWTRTTEWRRPRGRARGGGWRWAGAVTRSRWGRG